MPRRSFCRTLGHIGVASLLTIASHVGAGGNSDSNPKATEPPDDYSAGVRWFFMTAEREVPSHRLAEHLAEHAAGEVGGDVAMDGEHIANRFPAGAWLDTAAAPSRVHALIRKRAASLGTIPALASADGTGFPLAARAQILDLESRGELVHCDLRLSLKGPGGHPIKTTQFTGRGGYDGMHVFAAAIPEDMLASRRNKADSPAEATYLVMTANIGGPDTPETPRVSQNAAP